MSYLPRGIGYSGVAVLVRCEHCTGKRFRGDAPSNLPGIVEQVKEWQTKHERPELLDRGHRITEAVVSYSARCRLCPKRYRMIWASSEDDLIVSAYKHLAEHQHQEALSEKGWIDDVTDALGLPTG